MILRCTCQQDVSDLVSCSSQCSMPLMGIMYNMIWLDFTYILNDLWLYMYKSSKDSAKCANCRQHCFGLIGPRQFSAPQQLTSNSSQSNSNTGTKCLTQKIIRNFIIVWVMCVVVVFGSQRKLHVCMHVDHCNCMTMTRTCMHGICTFIVSHQPQVSQWQATRLYLSHKSPQLSTSL